MGDGTEETGEGRGRKRDGVEGCMGRERVREKGKGEGDVEGGRMTKQNGKGEQERRW